ncbi:crotonase/enoyl-CoA hydratase family protein [Chelativorans intermedius]|uniref:Crotonase/enoyl-CoA hydratase family protein n=1 Tax=Chelativorans intermedius TaxID=515947 RepID=A0ABV6DA84_9HYPH|nr:crotonase/enoyl-CoA hydratase family protein [Chelativorans intermedius]MCT8998628.1 crotonase/enoyl-CoA hydratase family protein [Chelativorans intermedius]
MSEHILVERREAVQLIRLNRPEKKNAITRAMYAAMAAALRQGDADEAVRCHLILGVPGAFSAGNDLADFLAVATGARDGAEEVFDFLVALAGCRKPLVSAADGIAVGIGATMHLHCDLTFATPQTVFRTPFVDLGLVPEAGSSLLGPRVLGPQRAFALLAMGEGLEAQAACQAGLIHRVVAAEALEPTALATARTLAAKPAEALRITRELLRGPREEVLARIREEGGLFRERLKSQEARAAFTAFMNRKRSDAAQG